MDYLTIKLPFDVDGDVGKELLSTAWLFRVATHRVFVSGEANASSAWCQGWLGECV